MSITTSFKFSGYLSNFQCTYNSTVVTPAVQNTYKHSKYRKCIQAALQCIIISPFTYFVFYRLSTVIFHFQDSKQTPGGRATLLLSVRCVLQNRDVLELRYVQFCECYSQAHKKSASRKKWHVLVPLDRLSRFKNHCVEPALLYFICWNKVFYKAVQHWQILVKK